MVDGNIGSYYDEGDNNISYFIIMNTKHSESSVAKTFMCKHWEAGNAKHPLNILFGTI